MYSGARGVATEETGTLGVATEGTCEDVATEASIWSEDGAIEVATETVGETDVATGAAGATGVATEEAGASESTGVTSSAITLSSESSIFSSRAGIS